MNGTIYAVPSINFREEEKESGGTILISHHYFNTVEGM